MRGKADQLLFRDRSQEFLAIVERLRRTLSDAPSGDVSGGGVGRSNPGPSVHSEFNRRASEIGLEIHKASQKLSKLAILAKKTGTYDDPAVEIQELTAVIKQDITALNSAVVDLQLFCKSQDNTRSISDDTTNHSTTVVDNLKNRLMSTTKEFKDVLTLRTEKLKTYENRKQLFSNKDAMSPLIQHPLSSRPTQESSAPPPWANSSAPSQLHRRRQMNGNALSSNSSLVQQQQQQLVPVHDSYMHSRADALHNVESTIHELGNIFSQLATMVSQQGEIAIRIDESMDDTLAKVEGAQGALVKHLKGISSNRWLMIKIFFVLLIFLIIFLFFIA